MEENRIKVRVGTMAPLDVVAAEAEQASREELVIVAENALLEAEDALKQSIFPTPRPRHLEPAHRAHRAAHGGRRPVDIPAAITRSRWRSAPTWSRRACRWRTPSTACEFTKNQKLPQLDLVAAYGASGVGGTQIIRDPNDPLGPPIGTIPGGFGDALGDVFGPDFPTWTVGFNISYPLLNRRNRRGGGHARGSCATSRGHPAGGRSCRWRAEVRTGRPRVETNYKRVETRRAPPACWPSAGWTPKQKKFAAGLSTNFLVTQAQRDLAVAEVAELRAVADYRESLVNFERVQLAGGGSLNFASNVVGAQAHPTVLNRPHGRRPAPAREPQPRVHTFDGWPRANARGPAGLNW